MADISPILDLTAVQSRSVFGRRTARPIDLSIGADELVLVDARDTMLASGFADLCCGVQAPDDGAVRFMARDWSQQPAETANALRGLIGHVLARPGWLPFLDATANILLQQRHHTRANTPTLRAEAARLATEFGLPGLPRGPMDKLTADDLIRAGLVRAFLGAPMLVILESPVHGLFRDLVPALLRQVSELRHRGGAAIWLTRSRLIWDDRVFPATQRLRLDYQGLIPAGHGA